MPLSIPVYSVIYSESDSISFSHSQFLVSGYDWNPRGHRKYASSVVVGVGVSGNANAIKSRLHGNQIDNIEGAGGTPSIAQLPQSFSIHDVALRYIKAAELVLSQNTIPSEELGSLEDPRIVYVTGTLEVKEHIKGAGVLVVEEDLRINGPFTWSGAVIVLGDTEFLGGGVGVHIYGAVLIKGRGGVQAIGGSTDIFFSHEAVQLVNELTSRHSVLEGVTWISR